MHSRASRKLCLRAYAFPGVIRTLCTLVFLFSTAFSSGTSFVDFQRWVAVILYRSFPRLSARVDRPLCRALESLDFTELDLGVYHCSICNIDFTELDLGHCDRSEARCSQQYDITSVTLSLSLYMIDYLIGSTAIVMCYMLSDPHFEALFTGVTTSVSSA